MPASCSNALENASYSHADTFSNDPFVLLARLLANLLLFTLGKRIIILPILLRHPVRMECYVQVKKCNFMTILPRDVPGCGAGAGGGVGAVHRTRNISGAIIGRKLGFFYLHIFHFMYTYGGFCFI